MQLAAIEVERAVEGAVGALLVAAALATGGLVVLRRWRAERAAERADPGIPALARSSDVETDDPALFGGGARTARVRRRRDCVVYGYPAAADEYADPATGASWCTLTVSLPGRVPFLVADHWQAVGQPGVPHDAPLRPRLGDPSFDSVYVVGVRETEVAERVLVPAVRPVLLGAPVQRLALQGTSLMVRTFDGARLDDVVVTELGDLLARFLAATPSFVQSSMAVSGRLRSGGPLPAGLYGPDTE